MSRVTDIILIGPVDLEDEYNPEKPTALTVAIEPIQAYLREKHHGTSLSRIKDEAIGGRKFFQATAWMGAINHLNLQEFIQVFRQIEWEMPEYIQLLIKEEQDNRFTTYVPESVARLMGKKQILAGADRDGQVKLFVLEDGDPSTIRVLSANNQDDWKVYLAEQDQLGCEPGEYLAVTFSRFSGQR